MARKKRTKLNSVKKQNTTKLEVKEQETSPSAMDVFNLNFAKTKIKLAKLEITANILKILAVIAAIAGSTYTFILFSLTHNVQKNILSDKLGFQNDEHLSKATQNSKIMSVELESTVSEISLNADSLHFKQVKSRYTTRMLD